MEVTQVRINSILEVMSRAACKDFTQRVPVGEVDDGFLEMEVGMNILMDDLAASEQERKLQLAEIERKNRELVDRTAMVLRELSTPIISVWEGVLTLPIIGMVDTERAAEMMEQLLARVADEQAHFVVIDITGVAVVDTRTADHFIRMSEAVKLLGAECFLTGVSPAIAQTIAQLGIDTSRLRTLRRLSDALKEIFGQMGVAGRTPTGKGHN